MLWTQNYKYWVHCWIQIIRVGILIEKNKTEKELLQKSLKKTNKQKQKQQQQQQKRINTSIQVTSQVGLLKTLFLQFVRTSSTAISDLKQQQSISQKFFRLGTSGEKSVNLVEISNRGVVRPNLACTTLATLGQA